MWSCICVRGGGFASISTIFRLDSGTVPTVWYVFPFFPLHFMFNPFTFMNSLKKTTENVYKSHKLKFSFTGTQREKWKAKCYFSNTYY